MTPLDFFGFSAVMFLFVALFFGIYGLIHQFKKK